MEKTNMLFRKREATEIEKYFIGEEDQNKIAWDPKITGFIENLSDELFKKIEHLTYTGAFAIPNENETRAFYMRIVDNHIEVGITNIEFIR